MSELKFWDRKTPILTPAGSKLTPEQVFEQYPYAEDVDLVLEMTGPVTVAIDNPYILFHNYDLDPELKGQAALDAIMQKREEQKIQAEEARINGNFANPEMLSAIVSAIPAITLAIDEQRAIDQEDTTEAIFEAIVAANSQTMRIDETATREAIFDELTRARGRRKGKRRETGRDRDANQNRDADRHENNRSNRNDRSDRNNRNRYRN